MNISEISKEQAKEKCFKVKIWGSDESGYFESTYTDVTEEEMDSLIEQTNGYEGHEFELYKPNYHLEKVDEHLQSMSYELIVSFYEVAKSGNLNTVLEKKLKEHGVL